MDTFTHVPSRSSSAPVGQVGQHGDHLGAEDGLEALDDVTLKILVTPPAGHVVSSSSRSR